MFDQPRRAALQGALARCLERDRARDGGWQRDRVA
jgi:hypothetical protein